MMYRVSFYLKSEIVAGRAPRYMIDMDAESIEAATAMVAKEGGGEDVVIRSAYKPVTTGTLSARLVNADDPRLLEGDWSPSQKELLQVLTETEWFEIKLPYKQGTAKSLQRRGVVEIQDLTSIVPIPEKISYVFVSPEERKEWYSTHKTSEPTDRLCHTCKTNAVDHYKHICDECLKRRGVKPCVLCKGDIQIPNRHRYCADCRIKRHETQLKLHREQRAKRTTIARIQKQLKWAKATLKTTSNPLCKFAHRYQGLRLPHVAPRGENRCRTCLQKFIDVQTVYLNNLLTGEQDESTFLNSIMENDNAHSHAAGV